MNQIKKDFILGYGTGAVFCTLGHYWKKYESDLLKLGFEKIMDYPNLHHNRTGTEIQSMYAIRAKVEHGKIVV